MNDYYGNEIEHITTEATVRLYEASSEMFEGIFREVRTLSNKKPEATLSIGKVQLINRILEDLLVFLKDQPQGKYLNALDEDALPQASDAVLTMVQFETALKAFYNRYRTRLYSEDEWITEELVARVEKESKRRGR
ncbi:MAG: hypothetical protein K8F90_09280 [Hyphomicrobiales bacterium]|nr:hypothetical protein [Hyphomicrobiales bacterium]